MAKHKRVRWIFVDGPGQMCVFCVRSNSWNGSSTEGVGPISQLSMARNRSYVIPEEAAEVGIPPAFFDTEQSFNQNRSTICQRTSHAWQQPIVSTSQTQVAFCLNACVESSFKSQMDRECCFLAQLCQNMGVGVYLWISWAYRSTCTTLPSLS